ncbi:MAG: diaminopimelate epimerase [Proteocatella sp.]
MNIIYTKINGNGNNFLVMDNRTLKLDNDVKSSLAKRDCNIKTSMGADGVMFVEESTDADFRMRIYNVDGSEAEMCGNGARCIASFAYQNKIADKDMSFETGAGLMKAKIIDLENEEKHISCVSIDMGEIDLSELKMNLSIEVLGKNIIYSYLPVGVPHVSVYCKENGIFSREDMVKYGNAIDKARDIFIKGTNVNFLEVINENEIKVTTFERGVDDLTDSCGTGSCSSSIIAAIINKEKEGIMTVKNPGGINQVSYNIDWDKNICKIELLGKVSTVARVEMLI